MIKTRIPFYLKISIYFLQCDGKDQSIKGLVGRDGRDGIPGKDGKDGKDGRDGRDGLTVEKEKRNWKECSWNKLNDEKEKGIIAVKISIKFISND